MEFDKHSINKLLYLGILSVLLPIAGIKVVCSLFGIPSDPASELHELVVFIGDSDAAVQLFLNRGGVSL
ncbi:MAG: hypothetical protein LBI13_05125 [Streptococcaceae bacterium]|jgi:hypothetical protein|nr:hypothetical protein [Streptococcaceae bacterium]